MPPGGRGRWPALWTFTIIDGVEPTNNHAKRGLRGAVIYRKLSLGSQSEKGGLTPSGRCRIRLPAGCRNAPCSPISPMFLPPVSGGGPSLYSPGSAGGLTLTEFCRPTAARADPPKGQLPLRAPLTGCTSARHSGQQGVFGPGTRATLTLNARLGSGGTSVS